MPSSFWSCVFSSVLLVSFVSGVQSQENLPISPEPCVAVMASFPEELVAIEKMMVPEASKVETVAVNGIQFQSAEIDGKRFVFFLTGMSLVNAASSTQLVLDRFNVQAVFLTGIAGGMNPAFKPGDVVIPAHWAYHSEAAYFTRPHPTNTSSRTGTPPTSTQTSA